MKFSVCWIAKNEADNIVRSIESVRDLADEMIVVDTGSTDDTVKLAEEAGARVEYFEWINDFSAARNHAFSLTTGDIMIYLDADEWFCEKLTKKDGEMIAHIFSVHPEAFAIRSVMNHLDKRGEVRSTTGGIRILRGNSGLESSGRIHETIVRNGKIFDAVFEKVRWQINHSGYAEDVIRSKISRNIESLEEALKSENDIDRKYLYHTYLIREYYFEGEYDKALENLKTVLAKPEILSRNCYFLGSDFVVLLYGIIEFSVRVRSNVSRKEIREKVVAPFKKHLKTYPGAATVDLYFQAHFDLDEAVLLGEIGAAVKTARKMPASGDTLYQNAEARLYFSAASAAFYRGNFLDAMEYAIQNFKNASQRNPGVLRILIHCIKGQPAADIVMFLNSQFDISDPEVLEFLFHGTHIHGMRDVHAYYLNKRVQAETATKGDYLYLMLIYGKYEEAAALAGTFTGEADREAVSQTIALAAVCSGNEKIFYENRRLTGDYEEILEAWFSKKQFKEVTEEQFTILKQIYPFIAFVAGVGRADEFASVFSAESAPVNRVSMVYCIENGLYEYALSKENPDENDYVAVGLAIAASVPAGRFEEAFLMTKQIFELGYVSETILNYLAIISEKAQGTFKTEARELYEKYREAWDSVIDLSDIVNTGYIADAPDHKRAKKFRHFTFDNFKQLLESDTPRINGMKEICRGAAKTFQEKSMFAEAADCLILALANCPDGDVAKAEIYADIAGLFRKLGNEALAEKLLHA